MKKLIIYIYKMLVHDYHLALAQKAEYVCFYGRRNIIVQAKNLYIRFAKLRIELFKCGPFVERIINE